MAALMFVSIIACKTEQKPKKKVVKKNIQLKVEIKTGWSDPNTYTVKVTDKNIDSAKNRAKHRILKDIVNVRVMNQSRYTDISKIKDEFEKPLEKGEIIHQQEITGGVQIYFQIRDKGLKKKFERK